MATLRILCLAACCLALMLPEAVAKPAKQLFGAKREPAAMSPAAHGSYAKGCLAGGVELPETGPGWQAMRLSRNRNWGHPEAIGFVKRLSNRVQAIGWPGLYIGDIAQPRGGPMLSGHRSHQLGLDIDVWMRRPNGKQLSRAERERISSNIVTTADQNGVNGFWTAEHHEILRAAAEDPAVARIFVHAAIKREMCLTEPAGADRRWLRKIRPWYGHNAHFHVRLNCPAGSNGCVSQAPPPPGDGCDTTLDWWFSAEARNPKPGGKKRRELTLEDLPLACASVLTK